ncbi:MAG: hypothetical protein BWY06_01750 [Candidatus Latescibacteria bacterium ADurb.Bin168]|nr:MAG: hypothetical protein BWY06_01750 [Candidatus Latescibacteria bacterium ADurb.Bin168]
MVNLLIRRLEVTPVTFKEYYRVVDHRFGPGYRSKLHRTISGSNKIRTEQDPVLVFDEKRPDLPGRMPDGKNYQVKHYNLQAIIAVGFKIENERAVQFRKWANQIIKDYTIQGWIMDVDRLKNGGLLTDEFFERQLEKIREIRLSERKFYQKVTDIYATALDYDPTASATKRFFAAVQNKLHFAFHGQTTSEVIVDRADHQKKNMGLATWEGAPEGKIHKYDVSIAKNYLSEFELGQMQRIVSAYLDMAEMQAMRKIPMTMEDWEARLSGFLRLWDREILQDAGKVTAEIARAHAESEFEKYRIVQDRLFESDFDRLVKQIEAAGKS